MPPLTIIPMTYNVGKVLPKITIRNIYGQIIGTIDGGIRFGHVPATLHAPAEIPETTEPDPTEHSLTIILLAFAIGLAAGATGLGTILYLLT